MTKFVLQKINGSNVFKTEQKKIEICIYFFERFDSECQTITSTALHTEAKHQHRRK